MCYLRVSYGIYPQGSSVWNAPHLRLIILGIQTIRRYPQRNCVEDALKRRSEMSSIPEETGKPYHLTALNVQVTRPEIDNVG